jgi:RNA polymerase sigma-70 factor, ECF subfamily
VPGQRSPDENEWIHRSQAGDTGAFAWLVERHRPFVLSLAYRLCGGAAEAEDIAQDAFVHAWQALPRFRGDSSFRTWIYHITSNLAMERLRKQPTFPMSEDNAPAGDASPETIALRSERQRAVRRAIARLPSESRLVLVLREYEGLSYQEIATVAGIPLGTVMSRLHYARQWLRQQLCSEWQAPPIKESA